MAGAVQVPGATPLLDACGQGDLSLVQRLVEEDPRRVATERNVHGASALIFASWSGHLHIVMWLVNAAGAAPQTERSTNGTTAFLAACERGHLGVAQWLLCHAGSGLYETNQSGDSAFILACANNRLDVAQWLYGTGFIAPYAGANNHGDGANALVAAAWFGHLEVVQWFMLEVPKSQPFLADTMKTACQRGHLHILEWIVDTFVLNGAQFLFVRRHSLLKYRDCFGMTPFLYACEEGQLEVAKWVASVNPTCVSSKNCAGVNALTLASRANHWAVCEWLMDEHELEPTAKDLTHVAVATAAARIARWRRRRSSHWLQAVVACGTGAAVALRATVEPSPVLQLLHDGRLTACDDGEGRPLRYMSWYGGMVASML